MEASFVADAGCTWWCRQEAVADGSSEDRSSSACWDRGLERLSALVPVLGLVEPISACSMLLLVAAAEVLAQEIWQGPTT